MHCYNAAAGGVVNATVPPIMPSALRVSLSLPSSLVLPGPRVLAPSISVPSLGRIAGASFRYNDWAVKGSFQGLVVVGLDSSSGLLLPHLSRLDTDVVDLLLGNGVNRTVPGLRQRPERDSHLTELVQAW
jgi:hypothetical protein